MVFRNAQRLDYDVNNHLYRVINTNGAVTTFGYDAGGQRLWESSGTNSLQVWVGSDYEEKQGQVLYHMLAEGRIVCTVDKTGTNVFEYYHPDELGSTAVQTDQKGNQIQNYEYSAFGQSRYTQNTNIFNVSRRYTGQVLDDGTGLYYCNARYYDPVTARFTQPDDVIPDVSDPQSYNRYSYCINNPLRYTDPDGHAPGDDYDPTEHLSATLGSNHATERQMQSAASARIYNGVSGDFKTVAAVGRGAAELNPVVGLYNGGYGAIKGEDAIYHNKLDAEERWKSGVGGGMAVAPIVFKVAGKLLKVSEVAAKVSAAMKWSSYGGKHIASSNIPWAKIIESTTSGAAKYKPGTDIEKLERAVWEAGAPASNGKPWKVAEFTDEIGASGGKSSRWVRVEGSGGTIHGHPITEQEFQKLTN